VQLLQLPGLVEKTLALDDQIRALAEVFAEKHHALFLGADRCTPSRWKGR